VRRLTANRPRRAAAKQAETHWLRYRVGVEGYVVELEGILRTGGHHAIECGGTGGVDIHIQCAVDALIAVRAGGDIGAGDRTD
jgi:hypothetical protein